MPEVRLENVSKLYKSEDKRDKRKYYAVRELSLKVEQGEFVFLIGSSGAGKSTMLKLIGGEISPDEGAVFVDDVNIARYFGPWKSKLARTFGAGGPARRGGVLPGPAVHRGGPAGGAGPCAAEQPAHPAAG